MQAFPRRAWERENIFSRSHALRGNAYWDAPRPAPQSGANMPPINQPVGNFPAYN